MKTSRFSLRMLIAATAAAAAAGARAEVTAKFVSFEDLRPPVLCCMSMGYGTLGIDPQDRIYSAWCGDKSTCKDCGTPGNCAMFQYDPETGKRRLLGTLRETAQAAGNLGPNTYWSKTESFMKGHSHLPYLNGKIFMGTQEFHSMAGLRADLPDYRGGHIFAYDIAKDKLEDASVNQPKGVFVDNQGIIQLWEYPAKNLIVGWTIPKGDLILYDAATGRSTLKPGNAEEVAKKNEPVREILITPKGQVYYNYQNGPVYKYDLNTKADVSIGFKPQNGGCAEDMFGFWNGMAKTGDGSKIYVSTFGYLYSLDSETGKMEFLTTMLPAAENLKICRVWGLAMSRDEKKIYWIPTNGTAAWRLYEYDIASNKVVFLKDLTGLIGKQQTTRPPAALSEISGDNIRDSKGRIYFTRHTYDNSGGAGILQIDVSERSGPAPAGLRIPYRARVGSGGKARAYSADGKRWEAVSGVGRGNRTRIAKSALGFAVPDAFTSGAGRSAGKAAPAAGE
jgi:outer membrane protein assembly factor BamB